MKKELWWAAAAFAASACVVVAVSLAAGNKESPPIATAADAAPTAAAAHSPPAEVKPDSAWDYAESKDPMTDKVVYQAITISTNAINLDFPYAGAQYGTLVLRVKSSGDVAVMLRIDKGQILCHESSDNDQCPVSIRVDDEAVVVKDGSPPDDDSSTTIFLPDEKSFIKRLSTASRLRLKVGVFQNGNPVFDFDVSRLDLAKLGLPSRPVTASR
jgi:hypothetical protein